MATIGDNVLDMATLVAKAKRDHRLTEPTILHILDINVHLSQQAKSPNMGPIPDDETLADTLGIGSEEDETTDAETPAEEPNEQA